MTDKFEWPGIGKYEEILENNLGEDISSVIQEFYDVEYVDDLTEEQQQQVIDYYKNDLLVNNPYSAYKIAFENLFSSWGVDY